jgi:hypothetical protein
VVCLQQSAEGLIPDDRGQKTDVEELKVKNRFRDLGIQEFRNYQIMNLRMIRLDHIPLIPKFAMNNSDYD